MSVFPIGECQFKFNIAPILGTSANGQDYVRGSVVVVGGEHDGVQAEFFGMFDESDIEKMKKTARQLKEAGWNGDFTDFTSCVGKVVDGKLGVSEASGNYPARHRVQWIGKIKSVQLSQDKIAAKKAALAGLFNEPAPVEEVIPF